MKKEETDLLKRCGTENPFTVPEGYFANFTEQAMDKPPEREIQPAPQAHAVGTRQTLGVHGCHVLRPDAQRTDVRG